MKAYVELVQRKERELGTDVLTHQKVRSMILECDRAKKSESVERGRLCRQFNQDRHGWRVVDGSDGCRRDGDSVYSQTLVPR